LKGSRNKRNLEIIQITVLLVLLVISSICSAIYLNSVQTVIVTFTAALLCVGIYFFLIRKPVLKSLENSEQIYKSLFDYSPNGIIMFDLKGRIKKINDTASGFAGYTADEMKKATIASYLYKDNLDKTLYFFKRTCKGTSQNFETAVIHKEGYRVDLYVTSVPISINAETVGIFMICQDITERKRADGKIKHMAYFDDLTGLPNRRLFRDQLEQTVGCLGSERSVAVLMMDIDRFKLINDSLGRDYGDILLLQAAERLTRCINEGELVARMEGDEFALVLIGVRDEYSVEERVNTIFKSLETAFVLQDYPIHITVSIGGALLAEGGNAEALLKNADTALSRAKEEGKNNFQHYTAAMNVRSLERLTMENEMRRAYDQQEFELYYQPQINIESGRIIGAEALIRWNHPIHGMIPPGKFIPLAEDNGMIVPIGDWVIETACKQVMLWENRGFTAIPVSVNLSPRQFMQQHLVHKVDQILKTTGLNPTLLELEITESMTVDVNRSIELLVNLKHLGVNISIDDFGTGYSSLSYLKKFPINKLKIDRSFVRDIMEDPNDAAIVTTIIAIAHHLNLKVIAEGVETEEQLKFLHQNHCNEIQGFYFSPPVSVDRFEEILKQHEQAAADKE
jgi:diguanylate cyclase (GGDEF)-like protein/PAS domain S-box-containing protein